MASEMFDEVYAHTKHLNAVIALKKAGYKWVDKENKLLKKITIKF